jgi:3-phenylpropionate/trans-cinnamate dioxygenase ferredoxin subunit
MARTSVGRVKDFANTPLHGITIGDKQVLLAKPGNQFFAIGNVCTHNGCRLSGGKLEGETVRCPCHGSGFSLKTGEAVHGPAKNPVPSFPVIIEGDEVFIDL